jgi:hypothetical protein
MRLCRQSSSSAQAGSGPLADLCEQVAVGVMEGLGLAVDDQD